MEEKQSSLPSLKMWHYFKIDILEFSRLSEMSICCDQSMAEWRVLFLFLFSSWYWGLNLGPHGHSTTWATPPTLFCVGYFWDKVSQTISLGWPWILIFLISASQNEEFYKGVWLCSTLHSITSIFTENLKVPSFLESAAPLSNIHLFLPESVFLAEDFFQEPPFLRRWFSQHLLSPSYCLFSEKENEEENGERLRVIKQPDD
jgi:hypothetical protein